MSLCFNFWGRIGRTKQNISVLCFRSLVQPITTEISVNRTQKAESVQSLNAAFKSHPLVVFAHYSGLTVNQVSDLRRKMSEVGAQFKVAKNRLAKIAAKGTDYEQASNLLKGPTAIAFSQDPVAAAKVAVE